MAELRAALRERDAKIDALTRQVEQLTAALAQLSPQLALPPPPKPGPMVAKPSALGAGVATGAAAAAESPGPAISPVTAGARPLTARAARTSVPARARPGSPGRGASTARSGSPLRRNASGHPQFFHASQRGGPLPEPLPQRGLSQAERENPYENLRGPSLLNRSKYGAKKPEWERLKSDTGGVFVNALVDDNPFNDPIKYWPFKGFAFPPSDYTGPNDLRETDDLSSIRKGGNALQLAFAYGFRGRKSRSNLFYNADGKILYHTAALGVVYDKNSHEQRFFLGHDDDITSLDLHPDKLKVVTGQMGKNPKILIWSSRPDSSGALPQLCQIVGDHARAIVGVSFSSNGRYIAAMGNDNFRSIAIYKWIKGGGKLSDMRLGIDKGHNDDVFQVAYNRVTDHVVAVGKKFIRFFGLKEGVEEPNSSSKDTKLSNHESTLWAKKGVFGKKGVLQDIMSVAFGSDGVTYAGTADGHIYRFADQTMDLAVKAHGEASSKDCKVTALWYNQKTNDLISSGDDGLLHQWRPLEWRGASPSPVKTIDMKKWVSPDLIGLPLKLDDGSVREELQIRRGSPAAAHSINGDEAGNVLVGTVCDEIYEVRFDSSEPPMCYMQAHHDELWGLATHPSRLEFCSASEDHTLRVWDLPTRTMKSMAKLAGPGYCAAYSPDGLQIAVGLGAGGKSKGRASSSCEGKWLVLAADELRLLASPPQVRTQRISSIRYSPNGRWVAVGCADGNIDIYAVSGQSFERKAELRGHSSFIRTLDWSADSLAMQSCCGAHELLYWRLYVDGGHFRPHQEKTASSMKDAEWQTFSSMFGWPVRGIWPEDSDGTDVNMCARSHGAAKDVGILATADDFGKVKLFRYPCIVARAQHRAYGGHSSHVTNVSFTHDDAWLISTGGQDHSIFQWQVVPARL